MEASHFRAGPLGFHDTSRNTKHLCTGVTEKYTCKKSKNEIWDFPVFASPLHLEKAVGPVF